MEPTLDYKFLKLIKLLQYLNYHKDIHNYDSG